MQLPSGLGLAAVASGLVAVSAASLLIVSAHRRGRGRRQAHHLLALGAGLAAATLVTGVAGALLLADGWAQDPPARASLVNVVSVGGTLAGLALNAGLLRLSRAAETAAAALRLLLDGLVITSALWFVGFVLL
ncbi:MAG TPA: GGDEF-domain containing protein, partial [Micromonospora sp.]|nr:GGDEF-domain containing protein [Micromonospora sp.]